MSKGITESDIEEAALGWFAELGYTVLHGPDIEPDKQGAERTEFTDPLIPGRLRDALLPKLLSGEIRLKDTDKIVEANV
ncbi:MAG: hypothetical protein ABIH23_31935 [bacterium]